MADCSRCGEKFTPSRPNHVYCSRRCATRKVWLRTCSACGTDRPNDDFTDPAKGRTSRALVCWPCRSAHPDESWCRGCAVWRPRDLFGTNRGEWVKPDCRLCEQAARHGTTVAAILTAQDATAPECAACRSLDDLYVDHDHSCCPGPWSCGACVRAYLCSPCNTAEGMLRTPDRALALARYMAAHAA